MNPAFGIATLFGQAFTRAGWSLRRAFEPQLEDLPIHVFQQDTESVMKPCGEVELVLRAGNVLGELGLTAVHSVRDAGAVRIPGVRALAPGQDSLRGPWA